jgi:Mg2+ and Co2+ transporter CorA
MDFSIAESAANQAISAEEANKEARRLNRLAAFFFPLVTLVSIFGMNPPSRVMEYGGFWGTCIIGSLLGFIVFLLVAKKK